MDSFYIKGHTTKSSTRIKLCEITNKMSIGRWVQSAMFNYQLQAINSRWKQWNKWNRKKDDIFFYQSQNKNIYWWRMLSMLVQQRAFELEKASSTGISYWDANVAEPDLPFFPIFQWFHFMCCLSKFTVLIVWLIKTKAIFITII